MPGERDARPYEIPERRIDRVVVAETDRRDPARKLSQLALVVDALA